ncbi:hypothetical protein BGZ60DRAFT_426944 [Tricladium varicosporioides]|nr:hypothetical protein BGZ60DRAFT_426944 [Hymenoscyphus varicosporioides]
MTRPLLFLWTLQLSTAVLAATGSVYVTDLPAFSSLAPCAASAISYVVQGLTSSKCPPGVTELVSCACTKDSNSAAISGSITSSVKYSCSSTASDDVTSALSVFAGYCNQGGATAAPTSTAAAAGVTAFITDLAEFNDLVGCARSALSYAVQSLTRYQCPSNAADLQSCACTKNQNSLAASGSINSQVSYGCGSTHTADVSSAQAVFAGYCGLGAGSSVFPSPSYLPGKVTYYITDLPQYSSLAPCARSGISYEMAGWSRSYCGTAPLAMVSCACAKDNNSGAINSGIKSEVLVYCSSTASADVTSALGVFDYYCSAGKGLVTPMGVTASVTATGTGVRTTAKVTGAGATATSGSSGTTGSTVNSSSSSSTTTKVPITAIIGGAVGAIVLLIIALFFIFRWRRSSKIRAAQAASAQAMMMPPPPNMSHMANMGGPPPVYPETPAPMTPMTPMAQPVLLKPAAVVDNRPVSPLEEKKPSFVSDSNRVEMETPPAPNRAELSHQNEVIMANRAELHSQSGSRVNSPQIPHAGPHNAPPLPQQNGQPIQELGQNPGLYGAPQQNGQPLQELPQGSQYGHQYGHQYGANGQPVQELPQGGQYGQQYGANGQPLQELPPGQYQQQPQHPWGGQPGQQQYGQQQQVPIEMQVPATSPRPGMGTMAGPVPVYEMQGGGSWPQQPQQQPPR